LGSGVGGSERECERILSIDLAELPRDHAAMISARVRRLGHRRPIVRGRARSMRGRTVGGGPPRERPRRVHDVVRICMHKLNLAWYGPVVTLARELIRLLDLGRPPVAVAFHEHEPAAHSRSRPGPEPAGCCFWQQGEQRRLHTTATDHAHCSVGSYTHGLIELAEAASGEDTAALVASGWVTEAALAGAPAVATTPAAITYEPLDEPRIPTSCSSGSPRAL
jgi:hypothetical protein